MPRSFGLVEDKLFEAEFFLNRLEESPNHSFEVKCYFSAFVSAARSITFSLQSCMKGVPEFDFWYKGIQTTLRRNALSLYFVSARNAALHEGRNPANEIPLELLEDALFLQLHKESKPLLAIPGLSNKDEPSLIDANEACHKYFKILLSIVYECYSRFKTTVDPRWYLTEDNFTQMAKTFSDALVEMGYPHEWAEMFPGVMSDGWGILRAQHPSNQLNPIFRKYLGKTIAEPDVGEQ